MFKKIIKEYILNNKYDIYILLSIFLVGIFIGVLGYVFLTTEMKTDFVLEIKSIFNLSKENGYVKTSVIMEGIKTNLLLVIFLAFLSITLICRAGMYLITLIKGMSIGLYTCAIFMIFGFIKGLVIFLLLIVIINIIYIPAYIYILTKLLNFNFEIFKSKRDSVNMLSISKTLLSMFVGFFVMFSSTIFEQIFSKIVISLYNSL